MESEVNDVARYGEDCDVWWVKTLGLISRFKVRRRDHNSRNMIHNTMVYGERKTPNRYPLWQQRITKWQHYNIFAFKLQQQNRGQMYKNRGLKFKLRFFRCAPSGYCIC